MLNPTLLQIHARSQKHKTRQTQPKQEVKRRRIVAVRARIDNRARYNRPNERGGLADDGEKREEKKLFAAGRDFGNHDLAVGVPGADEETVKGLVDPDLPDVVEAEVLRPDANHTPAVSGKGGQRGH